MINLCTVVQFFLPFRQNVHFFLKSKFKDTIKMEVFLIEEETKQVYDRVFKRIFSLSNVATINLINGLFDKIIHWTVRSLIQTKSLSEGFWRKNFADVIVVINESETFHLEAQMTKDKKVVLRAFEYGFYYAVSEQGDEEILKFPEPMIIYLDDANEDSQGKCITHLIWRAGDVYLPGKKLCLSKCIR